MDALCTGLFDDASPGPELAPWRNAWYAPMIGSLVVPDDSLAAVDRGLGDRDPVGCRVINTSGAGGLVALARRRFDRLRLTGVRTALRDLDDLAGTAARVAVAARELDPELAVAIELPDGPGWERAVEAAELEGLSVAIADSGDPSELGFKLSALIEADVPFLITGPLSRADRAIELIMITQALIDGAEVADAVTGPTTGPPPADAAARIRRRIAGIEVASVSRLADELADRGWLTRTSTP